MTHELRAQFSYDPESGVITRLVLRGGQMPGTIVGTVRRDRYLATRAFGKEILCHRLAWWLHYGVEPIGEIDHINGEKADNRIINLRLVDRTANNQNRVRAHRNNILGVLGVRKLHDGAFLARIRVNKKLIRVGVFETPEIAHDAYLAAKRNMHRGNTL